MKKYICGVNRIFVPIHCTARDVLMVAASIALIGLPAITSAQPQTNGLQVTLPNGYADIAVSDMRYASTAGMVLIQRHWDGQEWKFNPNWESLSQSWKNLTGSQTADTTATSNITSASSGGNTSMALSASGTGGAESGCYVWVDEDWTPTAGTVVVGGVPSSGPMMAARTTPFNRLMGEATTDYAPPQLISVDYANLCGGAQLSSGSAVRDTEGIRRVNELYLGDGGRYAFNNRSILEKRPVQQLPALSTSGAYSSITSGQMTLAPITNEKGYRWIDKAGDWIDYNTQGQVVVWGDKNDNKVWLLRDTDGILRAVVDNYGHVMFSLHYIGELISEIRDYQVNSNDMASRSVKYFYDALNRLVRVVDVRGYETKYEYDAANHITKIIDQENRVEQLKYSGDIVSQRISPDGGVTDYIFDYDDVNKQFNVKITEPETNAGRRVEDLTYNRAGKIVRDVINGHIESETVYDTGSRAEITTNARGFSTRVVRDEFDQIVEISQPSGGVTKNRYSAINLALLETIVANGIKTQYQRDVKGNLTQIIRAAGTADQVVTDIEINSLGQKVKITQHGRSEKNGVVTQDVVWSFSYDALGQLNKSVDPLGFTRLYLYDHAGNLISFTDPKGNSARYDVDAAGNLIKVTNALGNSTAYSYDGVGNQTMAVNARGKTTRAKYDALNRVIERTNAVGGIRSVQYDRQGQRVSYSDEDGRIGQEKFDNFLRLIKEVDGMGNATDFSYDIPNGSSTGVLGSLVAPTESRYPTYIEQVRFDEEEHPTSTTIINPNNRAAPVVESASYDKMGRLKSEADGYGKIRSIAYDNLDHVVEATDKLNNKTSLIYDAHGNKIQITDGNGRVTRWEYDALGRVVKEVQPLGQLTRYSYDESGNLIERIDANANKLVLTYDEVNQINKVAQYKPNGDVARTTQYTWDAAGNLLGWTDNEQTSHGVAQSTAAYVYDDANRKVNETITYPSGYRLSYGYRYSLADKKTVIIWADGTELSYAYSAHGQFESVTIPTEGTINVNEFNWEEPSLITFPGGGTQLRQYDAVLNLTNLYVRSSAQQNTLAINNTWGKIHELKACLRTDTVRGQDGTRNGNYIYDAETRLTQATTDSGGLFNEIENFRLDPVGNRTADPHSDEGWIYDANNRLIQRGSGSNAIFYQYDEAGNLIKATSPGNRIVQYLYDTQNRLVEVNVGDNKLVARYGYDPVGRRIWREQFRDKSWQLLSQAVRTYYLYSDEGLIAEARQNIVLSADNSVAETGTPAITTQYGPIPNGPFTTGILFTKTVNSNGQQIFAYYQNDHLGTPQQAFDKFGNVVWAATYDVYGRATIVTPAPTVDMPTIDSTLRLPGQVEDPETGLYYNYRRYYDPEIGRYLQADPIGFAGGLNFYAYANGNPLAQSDPLGLAAAGRVIGSQIGGWLAGALGAETGPLDVAIIGLGRYVGGKVGSMVEDKLFPLAAQAKPPGTRTAAEEAQADAEHLAYKNICNKVPPPSGDKCQDLKNEMDRAKACADGMEQFDISWDPGRHKAEIKRWRDTAAKYKKQWEACERHRQCYANKQK